MQQVGDLGAIEADTRHKPLFNSQKVCAVIHCQECLKPRCVFSSQKLQWSEKVLLRELTDEKLYTCGSALFTADSPVVHSIVVRAVSKTRTGLGLDWDWTGVGLEVF